MQNPIAVKLVGGSSPGVHRVTIDQKLVSALTSRKAHSGPAVITVRQATLLPNMNAGMIDADDIISISAGDLDNAIMVVLSQISDSELKISAPTGDAAFVDQVSQRAPALSKLAADTIKELRQQGVDGELFETKDGRWVNKPINTFTLKAQPRVGNIHFTLYGNPYTFEADGFLKKDQNSYSRGWISSADDRRKFVSLAKQSHARRG